MEDITCTRCGLIGDHVQQPGTGPHHAKLVCGGCGRFLTWLKKPKEKKGDLPPTEKQLAFIHSLEGKTGRLFESRLEASRYIDALLKAQRY